MVSPSETAPVAYPPTNEPDQTAPVAGPPTDEPDQSKLGSRTRSLWPEGLATVLALVQSLSWGNGHPVHDLIVFASLVCGARLAVLAWNGSGPRWLYLFGTLASAFIVAWAVQRAGPTPAKSPPTPLSPYWLGHHAYLGSNLRDVMAADGRIWGLADWRGKPAILEFTYPADISEQPRRYAASGVTAFAVGDGVIATIGGEWVTIRNESTDVIERRVQFRQGGGRALVAVGLGSVWICNWAYSKIDRIYISNGPSHPIGVPERPNGLVFAHGAPWVTTTSGYLVKINTSRNSEEINPHPLPQDAQVLTWAFFTLWISLPDTRELIRVALDGSQVGDAVHLSSNPVALSALDGSMFEINEQDQLSRIDPSTHAVRPTLDLAIDALSGLTTWGGRLFVTSSAEGALMEIGVRPPRNPRRRHGHTT